NGPGTPPRTRVEFTRYSHRIPVPALSDALVRCLWNVAKLAMRDGESRPLGDFYRCSTTSIAIVMRNNHAPGHEFTSEILIDVLWTLWQFASEVILFSATFTAGNLFVSLIYAPFNETTMMTPPPEVTFSDGLLVDIMERVHVDVPVLAPSFFETMVSKPDMLDFFTKNVDAVFYSGRHGNDSPENDSALPLNL
ncbi:MAG: hypothetical protein Q9191_008130, partial [Dirinaria sp. TL-2023a]